MKSRSFVLACAALSLANFACVRSFNTATSIRLIKSGFLDSSRLNARGATFRDAKRTSSNQLRCKVKDGASELKTSWDFSRFASTFTFFNGNPLGRIFPFLGSKTSLPRPLPKNVNRNEIILWDFASLTQVFY
jgi:hypothetical protein